MKLTRPTVIAANEYLAAEMNSHTNVSKLVLRLGLENEIAVETSLAIEKKFDRVGRIILVSFGS
ncbi:hypothetical protein [Agrobacterium vitis]|uniref:hypothetical protein n=1 Tax=Agrobacterium vitis TaxID=373 RepID=UPI0012E8C749|nr:hypothetical protein [Agrobacterium vitis]MVA52654.1 hypothetical protein [Agrobacterium vitis]MVA63922.1 hypothetical protein [Agrobacterium vitis]